MVVCQRRVRGSINNRPSVSPNGLRLVAARRRRAGGSLRDETATNRRQPPAATNCQLPTTANRLQPPTASHQPPPTTTNRHQPPVANCQPPTAANRQLPPTMVEHMECPRAFLGKLVPEHIFFSPLRTPLPSGTDQCRLVDPPTASVTVDEQDSRACPIPPRGAALMCLDGLQWVKTGSKWAQTTRLCTLDGPESFLEKHVFDPLLTHFWS